jgi:hypothetical protein
LAIRPATISIEPYIASPKTSFFQSLFFGEGRRRLFNTYFPCFPTVEEFFFLAAIIFICFTSLEVSAFAHRAI